MARMMALGQFVRLLEAAAIGLNSAIVFEPALKRVGDMVAQRVRENIGEYHEWWPDSPYGAMGQLAPSTIARKGTDIPLIDTGEFQSSIEVQVQSPSVTIGTNAEGAQYTERGTIKMIPRPVFYPSVSELAKEIELEIGTAAIEILGFTSSNITKVPKARPVIPGVDIGEAAGG